MLLSANVVILRTVGGYFDALAASNPLLHTWSLSVEEQFYLVFPLAVLFAAWWGRRRRGISITLVWLVTVLALVSLALSIGLSYGWIGLSFTSQPQAWAFYLPGSRVWEFAVGALIAAWWHGRTEAPAGSHRLAVPLAVVGSVLVVFSVFWINESMAFPGIVAAVPVLGTAALIVSGGLKANPINGFLATRPMSAIGDMSYSIYLWHWPIILFALMLWPGENTALLAAAFSFLPAYLAYRFVEQPIRNRPMPALRRIGGLALATVAVVILMATGLKTFGSIAIPAEVRAGLGTSDLTLGRQSGCLLFEVAFVPSDVDRCTFPVADPKGWIMLAGDSHADSLSNAVVGAGNELGYDVVAVTGARCPLIREATDYLDVDNCSEMNRTLLDLATAEPKASMVVLGQSTIPAQLNDTIDELTAAGVPVVLARDVPRWRAFGDQLGPDPCQGGLVSFTCDQPRARVEGFGAEVRQAEDALLAAHPQVGSIDLWPNICGPEVCSAVINGRLGYYDDDHLNGSGSTAMKPTVAKAMTAALGG
jgi:hypothetical protein